MMDSEVRSNEILVSGQPGAPGIVVGKAALYRRNRPVVSNSSIDSEHVQQQLDQFHEARDLAEKELHQLLEGQQAESAVELIQTQMEMIRDPELCERVEEEIKQNKAADSAVFDVFEDYLRMMKQHREQSFRERAVDIADVRDRLIHLINDHHFADEIEEDTILVARELSPREVIELAERSIKGIILDHGGTTSHAVIIARSMNIPTVVGVKRATSVIGNLETVVLDGENGEVIVHPTDDTRKKYRDLIEQYIEAKSTFDQVCPEPDETADGHPFELRANIEFAEELESMSKYRVKGVGLLRTESIYLRRNQFGTQEKQEEFYREILKGCAPHPVTIRLFDAGGDKFFNIGLKEQNPFLGWRGVRMLLDEDILLKNQIRAILRIASEYRNRIRILVPMISTIEEVLQVKKVISDIERELESSGISLDSDVKFGIMVEVPSVALLAENFAEHADFLSIGTNDLTQYVLAVDRGNELISGLYDQRHPAVWRLIKQVAVAAEKKQVALSVCGELASDPIAACGLIGMGIPELSMGPGVLPSVKRKLRAHRLVEMKQLADDLLKSTTMADIRRIFSEWKQTKNI